VNIRASLSRKKLIGLTAVLIAGSMTLAEIPANAAVGDVSGSSDIVLGMQLPETGPASPGYKKIDDAMRGYFDYVNSKLEHDIGFLSWHRTLESDLGNSDLFCGLESLYSNHYWNREIYLSDSAGNWDSTKEGKLDSFLSDKVYFQLLIHPEWWLDTDAVSGFARSYSSQLKEDIKDLRNQIRTFDDLELEQKILGSL